MHSAYNIVLELLLIDSLSMIVDSLILVGIWRFSKGQNINYNVGLYSLCILNRDLTELNGKYMTATHTQDWGNINGALRILRSLALRRLNLISAEL